MSIKIYKDIPANSIFIEDANGAQFVNSLQATVPIDKVNITDLAKNIDIVTGAVHTDFIDENDNPYNGTAIEVCNQLNAIFSSSGTPTQEPPVITSSLTINSVQGASINYELTANYGVGYEWDLSNVSGVTTVEGNVRKIIGGSSLAAGTFNIPVKAINYNGEDSETIVLTVNTPPFSNTKSILFNNQQYLGGNAALLASTLGRTSNGSGSSDAWTISKWFKAGTNTAGAQTVFYFGDNDTANGGNLHLLYHGGFNRFRFHYGSNNNNLRLQTANNSVANSTWYHVIITYNGGTTGSSSGSMSTYYGRFKIYINGVLQSTTNTNSNFGYSASIDADNFRFGRYASGNYMRGANLDEVNIWDSDQSANIADIYNGGVVFDTMTLSDQPKHRWRFEDSYPNQLDTGTAANCVMVQNNMTSANNVNDVP